MTDTPASTEAEAWCSDCESLARAVAPVNGTEWREEYPGMLAEVHKDGGDPHDQEDDPAPRTATVDAGLPLRDRLTEQERRWLETVLWVGPAVPPASHREAERNLRAALDADR